MKKKHCDEALSWQSARGSKHSMTKVKLKTGSLPGKMKNACMEPNQKRNNTKPKRTTHIKAIVKHVSPSRKSCGSRSTGKAEKGTWPPNYESIKKVVSSGTKKPFCEKKDYPWSQHLRYCACQIKIIAVNGKAIVFQTLRVMHDDGAGDVSEYEDDNWWRRWVMMMMMMMMVKAINDDNEHNETG